MSSSPSQPPTPNFSRPLPFPYNNMGTPTRQPRVTSRRISSADRMSPRPDFPPRTSSACQLSTENQVPLSASLSQPSGITASTTPKLPRRTSSIQDLASRFPVPPGPASANSIMDRKIERKVSLNDFLKEQWRAQPLPEPTLHATPEHPPTLIANDSKMGPRRQASFPSHERQLSKESQASGQSDKTAIQKLPTRNRASSVDSTGSSSNDSSQTVIQHPTTPPPNNGRPIVNFRPSLWKHLDPTRDKLSLNLFWPKKPSDLASADYDPDASANTFPYPAMRPLLHFHHLRALSLTGMERSYQRLIWQAVFTNPQLTDLTLEMALPPLIITAALPKCLPVTRDYIFPVPIPGWGSTTYLGRHGDGVLADEFGTGEYLDRQAMEQACVAAFGAGGPKEGHHVFGLRKLVLMGFVVDAAPFFRWFDARALRTVVLKDHCFDAGLVLPPAMMRGETQLLLGGGLVEQERGRRIAPGEAKIVTLRKGKVVDEEAVEVVQRPRQGGELKKKFSGVLRKWQGKEKESG